MAKKGGEQISITPEFESWLKTKNVKSRKLRRNSELLTAYHKEWLQTTKKSRKGGFSLLKNLPSFNLNDIGDHVMKANDILRTIQSLRGLMADPTKVGDITDKLL